jgi:S-adenosylmethionine:tRNA ribosyltransferase-isomerase
MLNLEKYNFNLPEELISNKPAEPRDTARLLVYDTAKNSVKFDVFKNLHKYIPKKSLFVFNNTKVLPARAVLKKDTGGKVEILFLINEKGDDACHRVSRRLTAVCRKDQGGILGGQELIKIISDRKLSVGQKIYFPNNKFLTVIKQKEQFFYLKPNFTNIPLLLEKYGITPIPKYLGKIKLTEKELRKRYQSIFAKTPASVAAPTASLHFTKRVLNNLKKNGANFAHITLNVGMGTFAPLKEENIKSKKLHKEWYEIQKSEWTKIKSEKPVIAVGTTAVRALESAIRKSWVSGTQQTDIFIFPPFEFKAVDCLITNFHIPKSSLMCLVDAFLKSKKAKMGITDIYKIAIKNKFRFYSFGDAMLIV